MPDEYAQFPGTIPGWCTKQADMHAIDAKLVRFAVANQLPLSCEMVERLAAAGSLEALRAQLRKGGECEKLCFFLPARERRPAARVSLDRFPERPAIALD
jgi:hypothetical protein